MAGKTEVYENGILIFTEDSRVLEDTKAEINNTINLYREVKLAAGMWYLGYNWATDDRARSNLTSMITSITVGIPLPTPYYWRDNNNNMVEMSVGGLVTFSAYLVSYINQVYTYSWDLKSSVEACETLEDVDAIDIFGSWPDGNMDGSMPTP